jgi:hypothetical protein
MNEMNDPDMTCQDEKSNAMRREAIIQLIIFVFAYVLDSLYKRPARLLLSYRKSNVHIVSLMMFSLDNSD